MLTVRRPQREWISWLLVAAWVLVIMATLPFARAIRDALKDVVGDGIFIVAVVIAIIASAGLAVAHLGRTNSLKSANVFWLIVVFATILTLSARVQYPIEAVHFVQYGVLGLLAYGAFAHRIYDLGVYAAAMLFCAIIGIVDETIQWALPDRVWDIRDIGFNAMAGCLAQFGVALGLRPKLVRTGWGSVSTLHCSRLALILAVFLGSSFLNTPQQIRRYVEWFPALEFLVRNGSVTVEYGTLHTDSSIGVFRSRFTITELRRQDEQHGLVAGPILDSINSKKAYRQALKTHSALSNPYVHEAIVHLARRNRHRDIAIQISPDDANELARIRWHSTIAYKENAILERYFSASLAQSTQRWQKAEIAGILQHVDASAPYDSPVSRELITGISERTIIFIFTAIFGLLLVINVVAARASRRALTHSDDP